MSAYSAAVLADAPDVYFRLDETSGNFIDIANGHNATPNAAIVSASSLLLSDLDAAAKFTWVGGLQQAATSYVLAQIPMTIELWINVASFTADPAATGYYAATAAANMLIGSGNANGWGLGHRNSNTGGTPGQLYWVHPGQGDFSVSYTLALNTTYHVVVRINTNLVEFYVNGTFATSFAPADMILPSTGSLILNNADAATNPRGDLNAMDEVAIYKSSLSAGRILAHFNAAAGPPIFPRPVIGWTTRSGGY